MDIGILVIPVGQSVSFYGGIVGTVKKICIMGLPCSPIVEYFVRYFDSTNHMQEIWMESWEIESANQPLLPIGFRRHEEKP